MIKIKRFLFLIVLFVLVLVSTGCISKNLVSKKSTALNQVNYEIPTTLYKDNLDLDFINRINSAQMKLYDLFSEDESGNYSLSPVSIYMALSLLDYVGDSKVKEEISTLLGLTEDDILRSKDIYDYLIRKKVIKDEKGKLKTIGILDLSNSIWVDNSISPIEDTLNKLADKFYCYAYKTPFKQNNKQANKDVRNFIKEKTNGLIDQDFDLKESTVFALINTLYFKDNWKLEGDELETKEDVFKTNKGDVTLEYLFGDYNYGVTYSDEYCESFYTMTCCDFKIYFIKPKDGVTLSDSMKQEHLEKVVKSLNTYDEELDSFTRVIFPSFNVKSETKVKDILEEKGYLKQTFSTFSSNLIEDPLFVSDIKHNANLNVNKKGVEGAAVTIITLDECADVYLGEHFDFVVDKEFGFVVTIDNIIIFMGQITNPKE